MLHAVQRERLRELDAGVDERALGIATLLQHATPLFYGPRAYRTAQLTNRTHFGNIVSAKGHSRALRSNRLLGSYSRTPGVRDYQTLQTSEEPNVGECTHHAVGYRYPPHRQSGLPLSGVDTSA